MSLQAGDYKTQSRTIDNTQFPDFGDETLVRTRVERGSRSFIYLFDEYIWPIQDTKLAGVYFDVQPTDQNTRGGHGKIKFHEKITCGDRDDIFCTSDS